METAASPRRMAAAHYAAPAGTSSPRDQRHASVCSIAFQHFLCQQKALHTGCTAGRLFRFKAKSDVPDVRTPREHYQQTVFDELDHLAFMMFLLVKTSLVQSKCLCTIPHHPALFGHSQTHHRIHSYQDYSLILLSCSFLHAWRRYRAPKSPVSLVSTKETSFTCLDGGVYKESDNQQSIT